MLKLSEFQTAIRQTVKGQDEAVDRLSTTFYKYLLKLHGRDFGYYFTGATSILLIGDSGSGKTFLIKQASELLNIPMIEIVATSIAKDGGWSGDSFLTQCKKKLNDFPVLQRPNGCIIFIDEFDKLTAPCHSSGGEDFNKIIQQDILKYIEGFNTDLIDFNKCIFVFAGVFEGLEEKETNSIGFNQSIHKSEKDVLEQRLMKIGLIPELCGRIQEKIILNDISNETLKEILGNEEFLLYKWTGMLEKLDIRVDLDYDEIIKESMKLKLGVRGMITIIETRVSEIIQQNLDKIDLDRLNPLQYKPTQR